MADRAYDIVLYGATGFTGGLTAEYLARHAGATRWALAGRDRVKLEQTRIRLESISERAAGLELLAADAQDPASIQRMAESARVVISAVGPYIRYGEPVVAACARAGTDYLDLTGEPEFVDRVWLAHHATAERSGARLIHSCGFDSIPHDLGVLYTVSRLPEGVPLTVRGFVRVGGTFSGGTYRSALEVVGRQRQARRVAAERKRSEPRPADRIVKGIGGRPYPHAAAGGWAVPAPTIDPLIVLRSARALERYGPEFRYGHYLVVKRPATIAALGAGVATIGALAQLSPTRELLGKLKSPGDGPSDDRRARSWFQVRFEGEGGGRRVVTTVSGGDPGYTETSKMLAESALCMAHDQLPQTSGQVTSAVALGERLTERLTSAGISFAAIDPPPG